MSIEEGRTWLATCLFLDIVEYSKMTVERQIESKNDLVNWVSDEIQNLSSEESISIDTGDGLIVCWLGDPELVYPIAHRLRDYVEQIDRDKAYELRLGINLGPVKVIKDINGKQNCLGAGINDAQRVMDFAEGNQLLISKSYFELLEKVSSFYSGEFSYFGVRHDKHEIPHELYELTSTAFDGTRLEKREVKKAVAFDIESQVEDRIKKEFASYVGKDKAETLFQEAKSCVEDVFDLSRWLTEKIEREDDRDSFKAFTKYYGFSS
jgi:class 3 adenylate cyclase